MFFCEYCMPAEWYGSHGRVYMMLYVVIDMGDRDVGAPAGYRDITPTLSSLTISANELFLLPGLLHCDFALVKTLD